MDIERKNTLQTLNIVSVNPVDHTAYKVHIFISEGLVTREYHCNWLKISKINFLMAE